VSIAGGRHKEAHAYYITRKYLNLSVYRVPYFTFDALKEACLAAE
jgi:hypothetical protein